MSSRRCSRSVPLLLNALIPLILVAVASPAWAVPSIAFGLQCLGRVTSSGPIESQPSGSRSDDIQASSASLGAGCSVSANAAFGRLGAFAGVLLDESTATSANSRALATFREEEFSIAFTNGTPTGVVSALFSWELSGGFSGTLGPQGNGAFTTQASLQTAIFHSNGIERYSEVRGPSAQFINDPNEMFEFDPTQPFVITGSLDARAAWASNVPVGLVTGDAVANFLSTAQLGGLQIFVDGIEVDDSLYSVESASGSFVVPEPSTALLLMLGLGGLARTRRAGRSRSDTD